MKITKRIISIFLALIMIFGSAECSLYVFAEDDTDEVVVDEADDEEDPEVLGEEESLRTANSRTYIMDDGSLNYGLFSYNINSSSNGARRSRDRNYSSGEIDGTYILSTDDDDEDHSEEDEIILNSNSFGVVEIPTIEGLNNYHIKNVNLYLPVETGNVNTVVYAYALDTDISELPYSGISSHLNCIDYAKVTQYENDGKYITLDVTSALRSGIGAVVLTCESAVTLGKSISNSDDNDSLFMESGAPKVVFSYNYVVTAGIDDDFEYETFDLGSAGTAYINKQSGNLVVTRDDIGTDNYDISSTFNSMSTLGSGRWIHNFDATVLLLGLLYIDENGTISILWFTDETNGVRTLAENDYGFETLETVELDSEEFTLYNYSFSTSFERIYKLTADEGNTRYTYTPDSGLIAIETKENDIWQPVMIKNEVSETTTNIIDNEGNTVNIVEGDNSITMTQISSDNTVGDTEVITKDSEGNVTSVSKNNQTVSTFTYDDENRMTSVENDAGYGLSFTYGDDYKVASVSEYRVNDQIIESGRHITYSRTYNTCTERTEGADGTYGNNDDVLTTLTFDNNCKLICSQAETVSGEKLSSTSYLFEGDEISSVSYSGKITDNLLKNHNLESMTDWSLNALDDSDCSYSADYDSNEQFVGNGSVKVTVSDFTGTGAAGVYQPFTVSDSSLIERGKKYVLSGYIKTDGITRDTDSDSAKNYGASLMIRMAYNDGTSATRTYTESVKDTNGAWERVFTSVTVPDNCIKMTIYQVVRNGTGTAYFDAVQLEKGKVPSEYNLLENNSFDYDNTVWSRNNLTSDDGISNGNFCINGDVAVNKYIRQDVYLEDAAQDDTYILTAKVSADSASLPKATFGMKARIFYADGTNNVYTPVRSFSPYTSDEQYLSLSFDLSADDTTAAPVRIRVYFLYYKNINCADISEMSLVKSSDVYIAEDADDTEEDDAVTEDTDNCTYDTDGDILTYTDDDGNVTTYTYNTVDGEKYLSRTETKDESNTTISYENYNPDGTVSSQFADGKTTSYTYDNDGNVLTETVNGITTTYTYDVNGNVATKEKDNKILTYSHTGDNLTEVSRNGNTYSYDYDVWGNKESVSIGDNTLESYSYTPDNASLLQKTYGNGSTESYSYNSYGQVSSITQSGIGGHQLNYDSKGTLIYTRDNVNNIRTYYKYDDQGRNIGEHVVSTASSMAYANDLYRTSRTYNADGEVASEKITTGSHTYASSYTYNDNSTVSQFTSLRGVTSVYDDNSNLITRTISSGTPFVQSYTYDDDGNLITEVRGSDTYAYTYDNDGRLTAVRKNNELTQSYVYDDEGQLTRENNLDTNSTIVYTYDGYGNILTKVSYPYTTGELTTATDTVSYSYSDNTWKDKLTSFDGESISYDSIGNSTNYRGASCTYFGRQLQSYSKDGTSISFSYDENGLRTTKTVDGTEHSYYYVDDVLLYEKVEDSYELFYRYDNDGRLSMIVKYLFSNNTNYYYTVVTNTQGDVVALLNGSGVNIVNYTYDSWGNLVSVKNASGTDITSSSNIAYLNSIRYRGYVYDNETGLYYLQSRYYDPETGRFINCDDVDYIGYEDSFVGWNGFAYCGNDAVNSEDPEGTKSTDKFRYIYVYYYDYSVTGHIDFSIENMVYSYGSNGAGFFTKLLNKANGYISKNTVSRWHKIMKLKDTIKLRLSEDEYITLNAALITFMIGFVSRTNIGKHTSKVYQVVSGVYAKYTFRYSNCATFVRDFIITSVSSLSKLYNGKKFYSLYTPSAVFNAIKSAGV